jgi:5-hydroxyisourate hydrolase
MGISTHILDTALGQPAGNVTVALTQWKNSAWVLLNTASTDDDGRVSQLLPPDYPLYPGLFRIRFNAAAYYKTLGVAGLYPYVDIVFETKPGEAHYHIPLLLTPNSYSTYRGS